MIQLEYDMGMAEGHSISKCLYAYFGVSFVTMPSLFPHWYSYVHDSLPNHVWWRLVGEISGQQNNSLRCRILGMFQGLVTTNVLHTQASTLGILLGYSFSIIRFVFSHFGYKNAPHTVFHVSMMGLCESFNKSKPSVHYSRQQINPQLTARVWDYIKFTGKFFVIPYMHGFCIGILFTTTKWLYSTLTINNLLFSNFLGIEFGHGLRFPEHIQWQLTFRSQSWLM